MNIPKLAQELDVHPDMLGTALNSAAALLRTSRENVRIADKKALRGIAKSLAKTFVRLTAAPVRERLVEAIFEEPDEADEDGLARYTAWCAAEERVDRAIAGTQDLLALVRAGESFKGAAGRAQYDQWAVVSSLLEFWTHDLGREVTISGHAGDPLGAAPSPALRFVHTCMRTLGEEISEQACRTIMDNLRKGKIAGADQAA